MTIQDVTNYLESIAPLQFQESYDNAGLIVGNYKNDVSGVLVCLDSTEKIVDEAIERKCNLIVAHHPIVFSGLKKITGKNYVERTVIKAIKNDIAIYAIHTNLDNMLNGVNEIIGRKLGLINMQILSPSSNNLRKLITYVPVDYVEKVRESLFDSGAGKIGNYDECSFSSMGEGTFRAGDDTNAFIGEKGKRHLETEQKLEVIYSIDKQRAILSSLSNSHPYEVVAYDILELQNSNSGIGAGLIGELENGIDEITFLKSLKVTMKTDCVRYTDLPGRQIKKVAVCGGSGSFLLKDAIHQKADVFITGDFKYHEFFDAENRIVIADVGHFESEQYTIELLADKLKEKFTTFAVCFTEVNTNPVNYL
jgi:dinuclear metal center YbgI/SA1388 family protein